MPGERAVHAEVSFNPFECGALERARNALAVYALVFAYRLVSGQGFP